MAKAKKCKAKTKAGKRCSRKAVGDGVCKQHAVNTAKKTATRVVGRPFTKGVSGNPSGRPKGSPNLSSKLFDAFAEDAESFGQDFISFIFKKARRDDFDPEVRQARDICTTWINKLLKVEEQAEEEAAQTVRVVRVRRLPK